MRLIFKADKVDEAAVRNLIEFDFTLNYNWHLLNSINIGCAAANWIVDINPIQNGGAKAPYQFFPVTSTNVGVSPKNFLTLQFNPFATLV